MFSLFDRAFPRHALVLLPVVALLAADTFERVTRRRFPGAGIASPWRARRFRVWFSSPVPFSAPSTSGAGLTGDTPADAARSWAMSNFPPGSRVLQDQHTPRLDDAAYDVHRLRVEEKHFVGQLRLGFALGLSARVEHARPPRGRSVRERKCSR